MVRETIDGFDLTAINGTAAGIVQAITDLDSDPFHFNSTLVAGAADAADITAIEAANGGGTINGFNLTAINGTAAAVVQAIADLDTDPTNFNSTLTGVATAADITAIEAANGTGTIDGSNLTAINGTAAAVVQAIADLDTDPANFNSTLTGVATAAEINTIAKANGNGVAIDGSALTAINGTAAAVVQAIADLDTDPTNFNSTLTGTSAAATDINSIGNANGNGTINGAALRSIGGSVANLKTAWAHLNTKPNDKWDASLSGPIECRPDQAGHGGSKADVKYIKDLSLCQSVRQWSADKKNNNNDR